MGGDGEKGVVFERGVVFESPPNGNYSYWVSFNSNDFKSEWEERVHNLTFAYDNIPC